MKHNSHNWKHLIDTLKRLEHCCEKTIIELDNFHNNTPLVTFTLDEAKELRDTIIHLCDVAYINQNSLYDYKKLVRRITLAEENVNRKDS